MCGLTQGSYPEHDFKQFKDTTHFVLKKGGAIYENYEDCLLDIDGWITFLLKKGIDKIFLLGHSLGCNKVLYYSYLKNIKQVKQIILLAPQDFSKITDNKIHFGMLQEAENNIKQNMPLKILSGKFLGFSPISSQTFHNLKYNKNLNNFSYKDETDNFDYLNKINRDILLLIGDKDPAFDSYKNLKDIEKLFENVENKFNKFNYKIIRDANHIFKKQEVDIANLIYNFITKGKNN